MQGNWLKNLALGALVFFVGLAFNAPALLAQGSETKPMGSGAKLEAGFVDLISKGEDGKYSKHGWNHYGPGYFDQDPETGILTSHGGMGLFWYSVKKFKDFVLECDFMCDKDDTNSGIFLRVPNLPSSNDYIYECFEIQIYDADLSKKDHVTHDGSKMDPTMIHTTGAIYDAEAPKKMTSLGPGQWNHYKITCQGKRYIVELNGEVVNDWMAEPRGKVKSFAPEGYIGLQNHDNTSSVHFRNIQVKEL